MVYNYNDIEVNFNYINRNSSRPIIFLHGWGRSGEDFNDFISLFSDRSILTIDFPPFGNSSKDIENWNIYTYVGMLMSLCEHLKIYNADFIGHSFGGRLLIILSAVKRTLVHSCILVDSAGMKPRRSLKYKCKLAGYKLARKMGLKVNRKGSVDYESLSPAMKETFKSIVNCYLEDYARKMSARTLIIWGGRDKETPLYMARRLNRLIKNSELKILDSGGHFSFLECKFEFYSTVNKFIKEE